MELSAHGHSNLFKALIVSIILTAAFSGCSSGGGGGGKKDPVLPILTNLTVNAGLDPKTLEFDWEAVQTEDVDHYRLEVDPDGSSGFSAVDDAADLDTTDCSLSIPLHLTDWVNARYRVVAYDAGGDPLVASEAIGLLDSIAPIELIGYFKASNPDSIDYFGYSIALSANGHTMAVGVEGEDSSATGIGGDQSDNSAGYAGAVYVFTCDAEGVWSQQAYIKGSNTEAGDRFGSSVALSEDGDMLAVGAAVEDSAATGVDGDQGDNSAIGAGAVYLFTRNEAGVWDQHAYVKASNTDRHDRFGNRVALSANGDTLAVGAYTEDSAAVGVEGDQTDNSADAAGAAYVFASDGAGVWHQQAYIKASSTDIEDYFGYSIALSDDGDTLAVGADSEDSAATGIDGDPTDNTARASGAVYVYTRDDTGTWSQQSYIKASNTGVGDYFGISVALSGTGDTLAVGASDENGGSTGIDGDQADDSRRGSGAVYVFSRDDAGLWNQQAYIKASNTGSYDAFGIHVALSDDGDVLAVGAEYEESAATGFLGDQEDNSLDYSGAAYVFTRNDAAAWSQRNYIKASNSGSDDYFGNRLALSDDGNTLAVGAYYESANTSGIDGNQNDNSAYGAGAVYLY